MHANPVYLFSRAQRARQFELWDDAIAWLDKVKGTPIDAEEFWYERRALIRQLLALGEVKRAYQAVDGYREGPEGRLVEAHFHAGWIALSFLKDAAAAAHAFRGDDEALHPARLRHAGELLARPRPSGVSATPRAPVPPSRRRQSSAPSIYGQLAREALGEASTEIRDMPDWQAAEADFEAQRTGAGRPAAGRQWASRDGGAAASELCQRFPGWWRTAARRPAGAVARFTPPDHIDCRHGRAARLPARPVQFPRRRAAPHPHRLDRCRGGLRHRAAGEPVPDRCGIVGGCTRPDAADAGDRRGNRRQDWASTIQRAASPATPSTTRCSARPTSKPNSSASTTRSCWRQPPTMPAAATPTSG